MAIENARAVTDRPSLIACRTVIGYGAPSKAGTAATHGSPLGEEEIKGAREKLAWRHQPFEVPKPILAGWRAAGARHRAAYDAWAQAAKRLDASARARLTDPIDDKVKAAIVAAVAALKVGLHPRGRQARHAAILAEGAGEAAADRPGPDRRLGRPHRLQRHADQDEHVVIKPGDFAGNYIHYGVREHAMAAAMNGIALHGGIVPYGGTFLVFTDYCRPVDPPLGADAAARDLCDDARLDRARRGRPDASAGRASGRAARHSQSQCHASGRFDRMRRMLGAGAARQAHADHPGADPPGGAAFSAPPIPTRISRPRAPMC